MNVEEKVIKLMIDDAHRAYEEGEIPVSAIILDQEGKVISHAYNKRQRNYNVLGHAEIECILAAEKRIKDWRLDGYIMVVSLEPCDMCSMVISKSRLDKVYYLLSQKNEKINDFAINKSLLTGYEEEKDLLNRLLLDFFDNMR